MPPPLRASCLVFACPDDDARRPSRGRGLHLDRLEAYLNSTLPETLGALAKRGLQWTPTGSTLVGPCFFCQCIGHCKRRSIVEAGTSLRERVRKCVCEREWRLVVGDKTDKVWRGETDVCETSVTYKPGSAISSRYSAVLLLAGFTHGVHALTCVKA